MKRLDHLKIVEYLLANPTVTSKAAGEIFGCHEVVIRAIAKLGGLVCERTNRWYRMTN